MTLQLTTQIPLNVGGVLVNTVHVSSFNYPFDRIKGFDTNPHNNYATLYTHVQGGELLIYPIYLPVVLRGM